MPRPKADWYFDVVSPFAYLQLVAHMPGLRATAEIRPIPVVLGGILGHWGQRGPAEIAPKRLHTYRIALFRARELGVPLHVPPAHPFNPINALRAIVALGSDWTSVGAVLDVIWRRGLDVGGEPGIATLADALGVPDLADQTRADAVKQTLRANGEKAIAAGVFGVPTFVMDGQLFWGEDATGMLRGYIADPALFREPEMRRLETLPVGAARK